MAHKRIINLLALHQIASESPSSTEMARVSLSSSSPNPGEGWRIYQKYHWLHLDKEQPRKSGEIGLHSQAEINLVFLVRQMSAMSEV